MEQQEGDGVMRRAIARVFLVNGRCPKWAIWVLRSLGYAGLGALTAPLNQWVGAAFLFIAIGSLAVALFWSHME